MIDYYHYKSAHIVDFRSVNTNNNANTMSGAIVYKKITMPTVLLGMGFVTFIFSFQSFTNYVCKIV